jgi:carbamoyl-phosphate synthase large subunit
MIKNDEIALIVNTTDGPQAIVDSADIRRSALQHKVYYTTTLAGAEAVVEALRSEGLKEVRRLQELHASI